MWLPGGEGRKPVRRREGRSVVADARDFVQEQGELDEEGGEEVGVDDPGAVDDGHGPRNQADTSRYLRMARRRGGQEIVPKLVGLRAYDAGANRRFA
jgi:hypothetical protein